MVYSITVFVKGIPMYISVMLELRTKSNYFNSLAENFQTLEYLNPHQFSNMVWLHVLLFCCYFFIRNMICFLGVMPPSLSTSSVSILFLVPNTVNATVSVFPVLLAERIQYELILFLSLF